MKTKTREKWGKSGEKDAADARVPLGGSGDHGYDVKQNVKREKKHAHVQQFAIPVVFDSGCGLMAEEKADEDSRAAGHDERKQNQQPGLATRKGEGQYERVKQHNDIHPQQRRPHFPEALDEKQQDDDGENVHQHREIDRRVLAEPVCPLDPQLIRVHAPLPFPVVPKNG